MPDTTTGAERPPGVPAEAWWVEEDQEWELGPLMNNVKNGPFRYWRADGTLCNECSLVDGVPQGPFKRFHENGEVSQTGEFRNGELHGTRTWFACEEPTTERMHEGGISSLVRRTEMDYNLGRVVAVRHFDAQGQRVLPDGNAYPELPLGVPADSEFRADLDLWAQGQLDDDNVRTGTWSFWTRGGTLVERSEHRGGHKNGPSSYFHPDGKPKSEGEFAADARVGTWKYWNESGKLVLEATYRGGCKDGTYYARVAPGYFADPRVTAERGSFERDHAVGTWTYLDEKGRVLQTLDLGTATHDEGPLLTSPAFADDTRSEAEWTEICERLLGEGHVAEAVCACARSAGGSGNAQALRSLLQRQAPALAVGASQQAAAHVLSAAGRSLPALSNALLRGAAPSALLRGIAIYLDQKLRSHAALDYVNAALALAPEAREFHFNRSLIHMSLGRDKAAKEDALVLKAKEPENAEFLLAYARILFPRWDFWPKREHLDASHDGYPDVPGQTLERVRAAIQKYATRLMRVRDELLARGIDRGTDWMLPDLSAVLPEGHAQLGAWSFEQVDGDERFNVEVDETIDTNGWEIPSLLRVARGDWNALCWLCWSAGLNDIALPLEMSPPRDFPKAAGLSAQRLWRCRDKVHMGGWGARNQGVAGFQWEGLDIDAMSPHLARMAESEYAEMQAMFFWMCSPEAQSPWQDNLRGS